MKKKLLNAFTILCALVIAFPTISVQASNHTHTDKCYETTQHKHTSDCYTDINAAGCGGKLNWVETKKGTSKCANNDGGTYEYTMYTGTCETCKKTYSDTVYGPCNSCGMVLVPITNGETVFPTYGTTKCTYQIKGESLLVLSCKKEEGKYYKEDGTFATPNCAKVVVSITPLKPNQMGSEVDCTLNVVYLDGNKGVVTGTSDFDNTKQYSNTPVTITYEGLVGDAKTVGKLTTTINMTTPFILTNTPTVQPTQQPMQTQQPTKVPTTNQNNSGNRLDTGNGSGNTNNNSSGGGYYNKGNSSGNNKFSGSGNTRGESVGQNKIEENNNEKATPTEEVEQTPTPTPRESVKVKITRPLTQKEKEDKIDSTMTLTKLLRNEENDVVGVKEKKEEVKPDAQTIVNGEVNKGNTENNNGKIMVYVLLGVIFVAIAGVGVFMFVSKKKDDDDITTGTINLQDSMKI